MANKVIYTDGSCLGNPGPGGWAWAGEKGRRYASGYEEHTTNNRMELMAVIKALIANPGPVTIMSDSAYVVNCFNDGWHLGWTSNGIKRRTGEPVANWDLWSLLLDLVDDPAIQFKKVKGHSGHQMNDFVDELAVKAARTKGRG